MFACRKMALERRAVDTRLSAGPRTGHARRAWCCAPGCHVALLIVGCAVSFAAAESPQGQGLLQRFDFEETVDGRKVGFYEKLPVHWYVIGRETGIEDTGFTRVPMHHRFVHGVRRHSWGDVAYDATDPFAGDFSLRLTLNGGSVGAFLRVGVIPAIPGSDYSVTAAVRTTSMEHGRARMVACFVDAAGRLIESSVVRSDPVRTGGGWQRVTVRLPGDFEAANWISLRVELNQPASDPDAVLGDRQVIYHQVHGSAWFDDIRVLQLPRLNIATQNPGNVIRAPQRPELTVEVRDFSGRPLMAEVSLIDHRGNGVTTWRQEMGGNPSPRHRWTPDLPRYGWYLVDLVVREVGANQAEQGDLPAVVAQSRASFQWLPAERSVAAAQRRRFQIAAARLPEDQFPLLPPFLEQTGLSSVIVSAWDRATTASNVEVRQSMLAETFARIVGAGGSVSLSLAPIPDVIAANVDIDDPVALLNQPRTRWAPLLRAVVMRHGQTVRRWVLGSVDAANTFYQPDASALTAIARRQMLTMAPSPTLVLPWSIQQEPRDDVPTTFGRILDVPASVQPAWLGRYLQGRVGRYDPPAVVHLRSPAATEVSHERRCTDLALRMLAAWKADPAGIAVTQPWVVARPLARQWMPDSRVGVFSTVAHRLAGRRWRGRLDLGEGLACEVFDAIEGGGDGMLAVWNVSAPASRVSQAMYLGADPVAIDLFGNAAPLPATEGRHHFRLEQAPTFIEGIDADLALFRAAFAVDPPFIESKQTTHTHKITLNNPWPQAISGELRITGLDDWLIEPRLQAFSIAAGQTMQAEMTVMFPVSELAGAKKLTARAVFSADLSYDVTLTAPMTLGLRDVDFNAALLLEPNAKTGETDAIVRQTITNKSDQALAIYAFASLAGHPRQERIVPKLLGGQVIVRRFRFAGVGRAGSPTHVRVGLREAAGPAVLNRMLPLQWP